MGTILYLPEIEQYQHTISLQGPNSTVSLGGELSLPAGIELACLAYDLGQDSTLTNVLTVDCSKSRVWSLVRRIGWPECRPGLQVAGGGNVLFSLPTGPTDHSWVAFLYSFRAALRRNGFSKQLSLALAGALAEIVDNVWEHSESPLPGLVAFTVENQRLTLIVADLGIGILESLRSNPQYSHLSTSMEALELAIKPGVSRFENAKRGYGFRTILHSLAELWGIVRIRSGRGSLTLDRTDEKRRRLKKFHPPLPGLQIAITCGAHLSTSRRLIF